MKQFKRMGAIPLSSWLDKYFITKRTGSYIDVYDGFDFLFSFRLKRGIFNSYYNFLNDYSAD